MRLRWLSLLGSVTIQPKPVPAWGWGSDSGTRSCSGTAGEHLPPRFCRRSRGFPTSCTNLGSVIHRQMEADSSRTAWDIVSDPRRDQRPFRGRTRHRGSGPANVGKLELSVQMQLRTQHLFEIGEELS